VCLKNQREEMINTDGSFSRITRKLRNFVFPYIACGGKSVTEYVLPQGVTTEYQEVLKKHTKGSLRG
jgi:hypothetical protein